MLPAQGPPVVLKETVKSHESLSLDIYENSAANM